MSSSLCTPLEESCITKLMNLKCIDNKKNKYYQGISQEIKEGLVIEGLEPSRLIKLMDFPLNRNFIVHEEFISVSMPFFETLKQEQILLLGMDYVSQPKEKQLGLCDQELGVL